MPPSVESSHLLDLSEIKGCCPPPVAHRVLDAERWGTANAGATYTQYIRRALKEGDKGDLLQAVSCIYGILFPSLFSAASKL